MAEIGLVASITGVAAFGAKISVSLFEFASLVGFAKDEVMSVGQEVSLFCAVLSQISSVLENGNKSARFSPTALQATSEISTRCKAIFGEIDGTVKRLQKGCDGNGETKISWFGRVKWTFQRSRVQLLRGSLDSMKITLHLMLATLEFSEKVYSRR